MRASLAIVVGLSVLVGAVFIGAGRSWGAVAMGVAGGLTLLVGLVGALGDGRASS